MKPIVVMGVAGSGKSTIAHALADAFGCPMIEGDEFHSEANREKMSRSIPLADEDRVAWLKLLGEELAKHPRGAVLTCSALKRSYRGQLRNDAPGVRFVYLKISPEVARARIEARADNHFFAASLVESQFATLEPPDGEPDVLVVDATDPVQAIVAQATASLSEPR